MHTPVLLEQVIEALDIQEGGTYIDATIGEGGHARKILEKHGKVLGIDWDGDQIKKLQTSLSSPDIKLVVGNFADIEMIAKKQKFFPVDGILFDLGLSMGQLAQSGRGFSYKYDEEPLDMRIDTRTQVTAAEVLNTASQEELYDLLARFGEDVHSEIIAKEIVRQRIRAKFAVVGDVTQLIHQVLGRCKVGHYHNTNNTASRVFQALRMQVNHESENLKSGLVGAVNTIKEGGKIAVLTFHSVEDRIVKQFIKNNNLKYTEILVKHKSPKSFEKSAKLRVFTKQ